MWLVTWFSWSGYVNLRANDASGSYIKRWLPELANLDASFVHHPWTMTQEQMDKCHQPETSSPTITKTLCLGRPEMRVVHQITKP